MEEKENYTMLDLMIQPGFCVKNGTIVKVNAAAQGLLLSPGMELRPLLETSWEDYEAFTEGCLYLSLDLSGQSLGASVTRVEDADVFLVDAQGDGELQALALAARELRTPLSGLIAITENLLPRSLPEEDPKTEELLATISRELYRIQRILGNMSDAGQMDALTHMETRNIAQVFDDIFEKAGAMLETVGAKLHYQGLPRDVYGLMDAKQMERAVLNILSNALKFMPQGGDIAATVCHSGSSIRLTIADSGSGLGDGILGSLFQRYIRQPSLEDPRHGLGLGMVMIRSTAACHGGTVLIDQPKSGGTRVSMTMKVRKNTGAELRSPCADLSGGRDQALIELSEVLPLSVYQKEL